MNQDLLIWLYPLGFVSTLLFGLRFLIQWLYSERQGKSTVTRPFWWISLLGNLSLLIHACLQFQYPIALMQGINGVIAWRNLDLMDASQRLSRQSVLKLFVLATLLITAYFAIGTWLFGTSWFRVPAHALQNDPLKAPVLWQALGFLGVVLFNSRFVVQWWDSEKVQKSVLLSDFWWLSLIGGLLSVSYFYYTQDPVNLIGPLLGTIPYIRNLMLISRHRRMA